MPPCLRVPIALVRAAIVNSTTTTAAIGRREYPPESEAENGNAKEDSLIAGYWYALFQRRKKYSPYCLWQAKDAADEHNGQNRSGPVAHETPPVFHTQELSSQLWPPKVTLVQS